LFQRVPPLQSVVLREWHGRIARGEPLWEFPYAPFCDNPDFVNGDLGTKQVSIIGLGSIGSRAAR
jgi:lactate dehydrogenase-like 2-hydroxyacid dehydrogenase